MPLRELVPWRNNDRALSLQNGGASTGGERSPFVRLHQVINRMFDDVFNGFDMSGWLRNFPHLKVRENDKGYRVTAEFPGMSDRDVDISFADGTLVISGERRSESEDKDRSVSERFYGRFERRIDLGDDVDDSRAEARFENGLLTIDLPRSEQARERVKRIAINAKAA